MSGQVNHWMQIRDNALGVLGELDSFRMDLLQTVVIAVEAEIMARVRPDVTFESCSGCIVTAGTLMAVSVMQEFERMGITTMDAGTMRLDFSETNSGLIAAAHRIMQPWYKDGFSFCGVVS